jgi:dolichol-phosphate mannosyltransferase
MAKNVLPMGVQLSIVIPFYNEENNVVPLLQEVSESLAKQVSLEMIGVDDGSTDATGHALREALTLFPGLVVIRHRRNFGQSAALFSGVSAAKAQWVATLDGDGQNDPNDIPRLFALIEQHQNRSTPLLIAGLREKRHDHWLRRLSSRVANGVRQSVLRDGCRDVGCGLKLFMRDDFLRLPAFDHMHRFLPALTIRAGGAVVNVPVNHRPRRHGRSKYGVGNRLWVGIVDLIGVLWLLQRPCRPEVNGDDR